MLGKWSFTSYFRLDFVASWEVEAEDSDTAHDAVSNATQNLISEIQDLVQVRLGELKQKAKTTDGLLVLTDISSEDSDVDSVDEQDEIRAPGEEDEDSSQEGAE